LATSNGGLLVDTTFVPSTNLPKGKTWIRRQAIARNDNRRPRLVQLVAVCGALDMDAPEPAITVMLPGED
jgi:hypothetical protein